MFNNSSLFMKMENLQHLMLEMISSRRNIILNKSRNRDAVKKRQRMWEEIHLILVDQGILSPLQLWSRTRSLWYRMASSAKANHQKYAAGLLNNLHEQDRKVLSLLDIAIIDPPRENMSNMNLIEEEGSRMRIEFLDVLEDGQNLLTDLSQISDTELKKMLLLQEYKLNEYKLLKMKFELMKERNTDKKKQLLKLLNM